MVETSFNIKCINLYCDQAKHQQQSSVIYLFGIIKKILRCSLYSTPFCGHSVHIHAQNAAVQKQMMHLICCLLFFCRYTHFCCSVRIRLRRAHADAIRKKLKNKDCYSEHTTHECNR